MDKITFEIPEDLEFIKRMPRVDWNILITKMFEEKLKEISKVKCIISRSKLSEKDVGEFTDKINETLSERY